MTSASFSLQMDGDTDDDLDVIDIVPRKIVTAIEGTGQLIIWDINLLTPIIIFYL